MRTLCALLLPLTVATAGACGSRDGSGDPAGTSCPETPGAVALDLRAGEGFDFDTAQPADPYLAADLVLSQSLVFVARAEYEDMGILPTFVLDAGAVDCLTSVTASSSGAITGVGAYPLLGHGYLVRTEQSRVIGFVIEAELEGDALPIEGYRLLWREVLAPQL